MCLKGSKKKEKKKKGGPEYQGKKPTWSPVRSFLLCASMHAVGKAANTSQLDEKNNQTVIIRSQQVAIPSLLF